MRREASEVQGRRFANKSDCVLFRLRAKVREGRRGIRCHPHPYPMDVPDMVGGAHGEQTGQAPRDDAEGKLRPRKAAGKWMEKADRRVDRPPLRKRGG